MHITCLVASLKAFCLFLSIHTNWYNMMLLFAGQLVLTVPRESLGVSGRVLDIAVYNRDTVFLACGDGLRRYTIKY